MGVNTHTIILGARRGEIQFRRGQVRNIVKMSLAGGLVHFAPRGADQGVFRNRLLYCLTEDDASASATL